MNVNLVEKEQRQHSVKSESTRQNILMASPCLVLVIPEVQLPSSSLATPSFLSNQNNTSLILLKLVGIDLLSLATRRAQSTLIDQLLTLPQQKQILRKP